MIGHEAKSVRVNLKGGAGMQLKPRGEGGVIADSSGSTTRKTILGPKLGADNPRKFPFARGETKLRKGTKG